MPIIQRAEPGEGDAEGLDFLWLLGREDFSPVWSTRDRAQDFPDADQIAVKLTEKFGYALVVGSNQSERSEILRMMKSGEIPKAQAIERLRALAEDWALVHFDGQRNCQSSLERPQWIA